MRMLMGSVAVVAALATGGVPAVVFTAGQGDGPVAAGAADVGPPAKPRDKNADGKPGYGPPAHARSSHNVAKPPSEKRDADDADKGRRPKTAENPHAAEMSALGRAHGKAMRAWSACVDRQPNHDAEGFDPEAACGEKPTPPGHLKKPIPPGQAKQGSAAR